MLRPTFKVAVLATSFVLLSAVALGVVAPHASGGQTSVQGATSQSVDPLTAPNIIEFRRSEHAEAVTAAVQSVDPLTAPNIIEFRRSEHAEASNAAAQVADPLTAPNIIEFRRSERAEAGGD